MTTARITIDEIRAAEELARVEFEANTVAFLVEGVPFTIAQARAAFEKYHPGDDWKRPVDCVVLREDLALFMQSVRFYHGGEPHWVSCRVWVTEGCFRVTGPGYQG